MAYRAFTHHFGDRLIGINMDNNPVRSTDTVLAGSKYYGSIVQANAPRDAERLKLPRLEAEASRDADGNVYVLVINQDAVDAVTARIEIAGATPSGEADVWTLNGMRSTRSTRPTNPTRCVSKRLVNRSGRVRFAIPSRRTR